ncbi:MAG: DUF5915 domain-containing protein [Bdellovibrionota bacterium]
MTRKVLLPFYNAYSFFATYAAVDGWDPSKDYTQKRTHELDQWIETKLKRLTIEIHQEMELYHLSKVIPPLLTFIDDLTNWYIRRSRRRFWKSENDTAKNEAYSTLFHVLVTFSKLAAPFIPFISENIYQSLRLGSPLCAKDSVHLDVYPEVQAVSEVELELESAMDTIRNAVALGRELREKLSIKNRQPLAEMFVGVVDVQHQKALEQMEKIVKEELNVHKVTFLPTEMIAKWQIKPNFKVVGKKIGSQMKAFQQAIVSFGSVDIEKILAGDSIDILGQSFAAEDFLVELSTLPSFHHPCHSAGNLVIGLDDQVTEDLKQEGLSRELINRVQRFRKDCDLQVENRIHLHIEAEQVLQDAFVKHKDLIESETLSTIAFDTPDTSMQVIKESFEGANLTIGIVKAKA